MQAHLVIKASDLTADFINGIIQVFSKDALLDINVSYNLNASASSGQSGVSPAGNKRGRKPKSISTDQANTEPKKRGRKPKVASV